MIQANFFEKNGKIIGFTVFGHANFADKGEDIVCSAVTTAVMLISNTITDFYYIPCKVNVLDNLVELKVDRPNKKQMEDFEKLISSLITHLEYIAHETNHVKVTIKKAF